MTRWEDTTLERFSNLPMGHTRIRSLNNTNHVNEVWRREPCPALSKIFIELVRRSSQTGQGPERSWRGLSSLEIAKLAVSGSPIAPVSCGSLLRTCSCVLGSHNCNWSENHFGSDSMLATWLIATVCYKTRFWRGFYWALLFMIKVLAFPAPEVGNQW